MLAIAIVLAVTLVWTLLWYKKIVDRVSHIPGPTTLPFFGNGLMLLGKSREESLKVVFKIHDKYGQFFRIMLAHHTEIAICNPKDAETVLSSQSLIEKSDEYDYIETWLGTGLLISTGRKWFARRKVLTPAFHFQILEQFVEVFDKHSSIFVKKLAQSKGREVDVFPFITLLALDVICETSMGVEVYAQTNSESEYVKAVKEISSIITSRHYNFLLRSNFFFNLSPLYWRQKKVLKILHGFTDSVILSRRQELKRSPSKTRLIEDDVGSKKKMALLDVLLQSNIDGKPLSNLDIREEVDTFMFEGHDTTTSGMAFCLYHLAKYPEVQKKAFEEIREVINDEVEGPVTLKQLNSLNYLELVIKETLRIFPSVPFYGRKVREDFYLNDKLIPKGANIGVAPLLMGRDPKIFKDPEQFVPERFLAENTSENAYAYVPFSAGPRNCIGQKFAMLEMKSTVSKVLRNFELKLAEGYEPVLVHEIILRPSNGIMLILKDRKYN